MTFHAISDAILQEAIDAVFDSHPEIRAESIKVMTDLLPFAQKKRELLQEAVSEWLDAGGGTECEMMILPKADITDPVITAHVIGKTEMQAATKRFYELHPEIAVEEAKRFAPLEVIASKVRDFILETASDQDKTAIEADFNRVGEDNLRQLVFTKACKLINISDIHGSQAK